MPPKFKKGQRVIVKGSRLPIPMKEDQMGTVLEDERDFYDISIGFDNNVKGHDCNFLCTYGHGWWISKELIKLEPEKIEDDDYLYI